MPRREQKRKNCVKCNKSLRRIDWYYRNGKYFCNINCFKSFIAKPQDNAAS